MTRQPGNGKQTVVLGGQQTTPFPAVRKPCFMRTTALSNHLQATQGL
ncbi:MAG: hypothetical protein KatS3mg056_2001 [Chloroflexus sp.]|nr:MAG: hypothetical protein KatS3mg056_2001 [Chloroflexus sp.]